MAGLEGREDALVRTLAGGGKQRLALGCAILHRPPVLFLDEPTSGVEPEARRRFWELIHHLASDDVTILVSTHYMEEAEYCNRIILISKATWSPPAARPVAAARTGRRPVLTWSVRRPVLRCRFCSRHPE